eukprot:GILK01001311.1.p1 GENE.GILK01001311.1~~GILK01001311.1.p1  ORF type:complete len:569 (+),score=101.20 GILK01001311.1:56-1762(+)
MEGIRSRLIARQPSFLRYHMRAAAAQIHNVALRPIQRVSVGRPVGPFNLNMSVRQVSSTRSLLSNFKGSQEDRAEMERQLTNPDCEEDLENDAALPDSIEDVRPSEVYETIEEMPTSRFWKPSTRKGIEAYRKLYGDADPHNVFTRMPKLRKKDPKLSMKEFVSKQNDLKLFAAGISPDRVDVEELEMAIKSLRAHGLTSAEIDSYIESATKDELTEPEEMEFKRLIEAAGKDPEQVVDKDTELELELLRNKIQNGHVGDMTAAEQSLAQATEIIKNLPGGIPYGTYEDPDDNDGLDGKRNNLAKVREQRAEKKWLKKMRKDIAEGKAVDPRLEIALQGVAELDSDDEGGMGLSKSQRRLLESMDDLDDDINGGSKAKSADDSEGESDRDDSSEDDIRFRPDYLRSLVMMDERMTQRTTVGNRLSTARTLVVAGREQYLGYAFGKGERSTERAQKKAEARRMYVDADPVQGVLGPIKTKFNQLRLVMTPRGPNMPNNVSKALVWPCKLAGLNTVAIKMHGRTTTPNQTQAVFQAFTQVRSLDSIARSLGRKFGDFGQLYGRKKRNPPR